MSHSVMPGQSPGEAGASSGASPAREFDYRPLPVLAPVTLVAGLLSTLALLSLFGVLIGLVGVMLGIGTLWKIRGGEFGGRRMTWTGLLLSLGFFVFGIGWHTYLVATEVPEGYRRINFSRDISAKELQYRRKGEFDVHADVKALDGQKIFLKGYIYPTNRTEDLPSFLLVKDNRQCCFGGQPEVTDMILVQMQDGQTIDYLKGLVSVAGVFRVEPARGPEGLTPLYRLEGTHFEQARTSF